MTKDNNPIDTPIDRRGALECMVWAGTGLLWTIAGGVPQTSSLLGVGTAHAQAATGFSFLQISDSHIGFKQAANPNPLATLQEAIGKIDGIAAKPAFMIHTGDISHLSKPEEFDDAEKVITNARLDVHYVPGEHDIIDEGRGALYLERFGKKQQAQGSGWYAFDHEGVHFIGLVNVADLKAGGMGALGAAQIAWLADDLKTKASSTPLVIFAHIPLWTVYTDWGWGTDDAAQALALVKRFGSVTVLNGHIHQIMQKVEGAVTFHTARSTAFPQPAPGTAPSPGPMKVADDRLRSVLGIASIAVKRGTQPLAIIDSELVKA
ncbi:MULTISPECIES: metallophosphoesterase [unclassified Beijerinckia]|uniref:metallophosphoesterase family protein n=1 Tax=unclassified Beijerinckia TaxID=2638183 RepID=UPI00089A6CB2|nr:MULTISPECIES: metallophosphoesterase [unclassified Beijerinckia]MDH7796718.1 3',5'-cyclic AMP phosphodiesterase CpdA [Beijerinckia sp. GAS462]SEC57024.1 3',5'-cyclic AMP phosphodiesterase CpdA [Beijerinckia sp. 28-YEA-48]